MMGTQNKRNIWVSTPSNKFWEFLAIPNFKSLALLTTVGLMSLSSASAQAADDAYSDYQGTTYVGSNLQAGVNVGETGAVAPAEPTFKSTEATLNPNYVSSISPAAGEYIGDNARIEDTRPVINNDAVLAHESKPPVPVKEYFTEKGDFVFGAAGQRGNQQ